jgi:hypothetical protein
LNALTHLVCRIFIFIRHGLVTMYRKIYDIVCCFERYENWSPKLREEHRLREIQKRELRRIFGPKRKKAAG